uniref:Uncharacterized protein n=1 Tax=Anguilla anguilla TaxID=7936 RepID=A0A0E9W5J7_ANGAN
MDITGFAYITLFYCLCLKARTEACIKLFFRFSAPPVWNELQKRALLGSDARII